jgi:pimeloyl-ACP methyl ester carboxylesterase
VDRWCPALFSGRGTTDPAVDLFLADVPGPGDRTPLVVHGGPDWDHSYLREPLERLGGDRRVLLPDLRGCGRSTCGLPMGDYTWDAAVGDPLALLDALGIARADVLGFSPGGAIAQRLVLAAPDRVRSLIVGRRRGSRRCGTSSTGGDVRVRVSGH